MLRHKLRSILDIPRFINAPPYNIRIHRYSNMSSNIRPDRHRPQYSETRSNRWITERVRKARPVWRQLRACASWIRRTTSAIRRSHWVRGPAEFRGYQWRRPNRDCWAIRCNSPDWTASVRCSSGRRHQYICHGDNQWRGQSTCNRQPIWHCCRRRHQPPANRRVVKATWPKNVILNISVASHI